MTYREKLKQDHPEALIPDRPGGCVGCPGSYGYEPGGNEDCRHMTCTYCWDREIPGTKKPIIIDKDHAFELTKDMLDPIPGEHDPVNHPSHYTAGGIECIDAITAALTCHTDPVDAWLTGQVLKYLWRWPLKNGLEDLKKAQFYLNRLIEREEKKE